MRDRVAGIPAADLANARINMYFGGSRRKAVPKPVVYPKMIHVTENVPCVIITPTGSLEVGVRIGNSLYSVIIEKDGWQLHCPIGGVSSKRKLRYMRSIPMGPLSKRVLTEQQGVPDAELWGYADPVERKHILARQRRQRATRSR